VSSVFDVPVPGGTKFQHAELAVEKGATQHADDTLAVLDGLLDAAKDHSTQREVTRMVAHPVSTAVTFFDVAAFQTVNYSLGQGIIGPSTRDKRVKCHVFVSAFIHVKRMNVELGKDFDARAVYYDETHKDQNHCTSHCRQHYLQPITRHKAGMSLRIKQDVLDFCDYGTS